MGVKSALKCFVLGLVFTLIMVVAVPIFVDSYATKYFEELIGDSSFLVFSSEVIVSLLTWMLIIGFMLLLGAGGILKKFGVFGILGLVVAYWLLGDVTDAFMPLATLGIVLAISKTISHKKKKSGTDGKC